MSQFWSLSGILASLALAGTTTVSYKPTIAQTGAPPLVPNSPSQPCHILTPAQVVPNGFGAAYNLFSDAKELLLNVECGSSSNATITVGNGQNTTYIYRTGYEWTGTEWRAISLGGPTLVAGDWYVGNASADLVRSQTQLSQDNFVVAYTCQSINKAWKCGCRDTSCSQNYWQLQAFKLTAPTAPSGDTGTVISNDTGISDAPLKPANTVVKTVCASGCDYSNIQTAVNATKPGWTLQIKTGIYPGNITIQDKNCTKDEPCALIAFPGHKPVIKGNNSSGHGLRLIRSDWWILDGLESTNHYSFSMNVCSSHVTVRNNYVHDNFGRTGTAGITVNCPHNPAGTHNVLLDNNRIAREGVNGCTFSEIGSSPRHCHGFYLGNSSDPCRGLSRVTVRNNVVQEMGGSAVQMRGQGCTNMRDILVENNILLNTQSGFNISGGIQNVAIRNNTLVANSWPDTNSSSVHHIYIDSRGGLSNFAIQSNIFASTNTQKKSFFWWAGASVSNWNVNNNVWRVATNDWSWKGQSRRDFLSAYKSVSGWDSNGKCCSVDPMFLSLSNFRLQPASPARNAGNNAQCAPNDFDRSPRPYEGICDVGAFEYKP